MFLQWIRMYCPLPTIYCFLLKRFGVASLEKRRNWAKVCYLHKVVHGLEENEVFLQSLNFRVGSTINVDMFYLPKPRIAIYKK